MDDFYPTPIKLIARMIEGLDFNAISDVLEPSAGKGDICDAIKDIRKYGKYFKIDVIEIVPDLQATLKGKGYNLVHDDFLSFSTYKHYDLILANFPFSEGDKHLMRGIELLEQSGGLLVCLVNAETIKNPFSNLRKAILATIEKHAGTIEFLQDEFTQAERKTTVEVALIRIYIDAPLSTLLLDTLKKESNLNLEDISETAILENNLISSLIARFNFETKSGLKLIDEYFSLKPFLSDSFGEYKKPLIELAIRDGYETKSSYANSYICGLRDKYWNLLIGNEEFRIKYTSNILSDLWNKMKELRECDFTKFNIQKLEEELNKKISVSLEKTVLDLFDQFSQRHAYSDEFGKNVHYYNGWKTNKAHKINKKVILPIYGFSSWNKDRLDYHVKDKLNDIVKALNYLSSEIPNVNQLVGSTISEADTLSDFRNMDFHYFDATFYKKGTCHIVFKDEKLLDKFNIFGSQRKGWLPPSYGKKRYKDMDSEEKTIIDEFQGEEQYERIIENYQEYIVDNKQLSLK